MVSMSTLTRGKRRFIDRVAASPSMRGIRTSMSTRSGRSRRHSSSASCPSAASPTILRSGSPESMTLMPDLTKSWSSTITSRAGPPPPSGLLSGTPTSQGTLLETDGNPSLIRVVPRQRDLGYYQRADAGSALNLKPAIEERYPFLHAAEPHPLARSPAAGRRGIETLAPVPDAESHTSLQSVEGHAHPPSVRVPADVGQRLLCYPEERRLDSVREPLVVCHVALETHFPVVPTQPICFQAERGCKPEVVEGRGPQVGDDPARLPHRPLDQFQSLGQYALAFLGGRGVETCKALEMLVGCGGYLRETVMHLVGDAPALFFLCAEELPDEIGQPPLAFGELSVEPGVLQRACGLGCQAAQYLHRVVLREGLGSVGLQHTSDPPFHSQGQVEPNEIFDQIG